MESLFILDWVTEFFEAFLFWRQNLKQKNIKHSQCNDIFMTALYGVILRDVP